MEWTVVATYHGECCTNAHIWAERVVAETAQKAITKMRTMVRKEEFEPHDMLVFAGSLDIDAGGYRTRWSAIQTACVQVTRFQRAGRAR